PYVYHPYLHSFPTRRSSDLHLLQKLLLHIVVHFDACIAPIPQAKANPVLPVLVDVAKHLDGLLGVYEAEIWRKPGVPAGSSIKKDRKSTRLNSSHLGISYAV